MNIILDYFPVIFFFISFKFYGIYVATAIVILASLLQISIFWFKHHKVSPVHILTCVILIVFGGMTLLLKNPIFIKLKPTIVSWLLAIICIISQFFTKKTFFQYLLDKKIELPTKIWRNINYLWAGFFAVLGLSNIYVAYSYNTDIWVNFKLFGVVGSTVVFSIIQSLYINKHIVNDNHKSN